MKKLALFTCVLTTVTLFQSCDQLGLEFDQVFDKVFDVNIADNQNGTGDFTTVQTINVNDGDLKENLDKVEELDIKSIKLEFSDYTGSDSAIVNGTINFSQILSNTYTFPELNIFNLETNNEPFVLYDKEGASFPGGVNFPANEFITNLVNFLKVLPADQLNFNYTASSTEYPINFKAKILVDVHVKVSATE